MRAPAERFFINDLDFAVANGEEVHVVKMYRYLLEPNCLATVVDDVVASGAISRFVDFLLRDDAWELQYESAWAITNVAAGSREHTTAAAAAVPNLVRLLAIDRATARYTNPAFPARDADNIVTTAMWALANIAGDGRELRDRDVRAYFYVEHERDQRHVGRLLRRRRSLQFIRNQRMEFGMQPAGPTLQRRHQRMGHERMHQRTVHVLQSV